MELRRFAVTRTSGRDLSAVRRPVRPAVEVARPTVEANDADVKVDYSEWRKADLVELAKSRGLDSSGNKDDIVGRLNG